MGNENKKTRREFMEEVIIKAPVAAGLFCIALSPCVSASAKGKDDIISMTTIDPAMILYREIMGHVSTGFTESRSVSADRRGGFIVSGDMALMRIDYSGKIRETINLNLSPYCAVSTDTGYYIALKQRIIITDKKGNVQSEWPALGDNSWITGIELDDEHLFIADAGQRIVWCYDRNGGFVRKIGEKNPDRNIPGFIVPGPYFDLAMAPDGLLRVANPGRHRVEAYTVMGDLEFSWGEFGSRPENFSTCCNPVSFTILRDGDIITCEKGTARVKVYDSAGNLKGFVAEPEELANVTASIGSKRETTQAYGFDIAADIDGHLCILDRARNVVRFYEVKKNGFPPLRE
jgi:hypothetical protein